MAWAENSSQKPWIGMQRQPAPLPNALTLSKDSKTSKNTKAKQKIKETTARPYFPFCSNCLSEVVGGRNLKREIPKPRFPSFNQISHASFLNWIYTAKLEWRSAVECTSIRSMVQITSTPTSPPSMQALHWCNRLAWGDQSTAFPIGGRPHNRYIDESLIQAVSTTSSKNRIRSAYWTGVNFDSFPLFVLFILC